MRTFEELQRTAFARSESEESELDEYLRMLILHEAITPFFQPIVDLTAGTIFGYEVVSRGMPPLELPDDMFPRARRLGLAQEFELICLKATLRKLKTLTPEQRFRSKFFVNITPSLIGDPALHEELSKGNLRLYDLEENNLVLEITEREAVADFPLFEKALRDFNRQGFTIAMDDFGCGHASYLQLLAARPRYIKLDRDFVRNLHLDQYRQYLLKSVVSFADTVEARLVAEGVEYWEELEVLMRLGVRFVQGFLFGMPESEPLLPSVNIMSSMQDRVRKFQNTLASSDEVITNLLISSYTIPRDSVTCAELGELLQENPSLDHVVILEAGRPTGLLTRQHFLAQTTGPYGFPLFQTQRVDTFAKRDFLSIEETLPVDVLAKLAMDRVQENIYDPVVVVDAAHHYIGTITMKALITRSFDLEVRRALDTNPLTNLPGNRAIERWINDALLADECAVIYADLDRFKEYNDAYGFLAGDEMIRLTGRVLTDIVRQAGSGFTLGHVGGDDFIIVGRGSIPEEAMAQACTTFDQAKLEHFQREHIEEGIYWSVNRQGERIKVPLVTMSLSMIIGKRMPDVQPHPAMLSQRAAALKKRVKEMAYHDRRSTHFVDRRVFPSTQEVIAFAKSHAAAHVRIDTPPPPPSSEMVPVTPGFLETLDWTEQKKA